MFSFRGVAQNHQLKANDISKQLEVAEVYQVDVSTLVPRLFHFNQRLHKSKETAKYFAPTLRWFRMIIFASKKMDEHGPSFAMKGVIYVFLFKRNQAREIKPGFLATIAGQQVTT